jgi:hypothetical protein
MPIGALGIALLYALINGTVEELFWRGAFVFTFPDDILRGYFFPTVFFGRWHVALYVIKGMKFQGGFAALVGQDPTSPAVRAQVERWRAVLAARFYACDDAMLANLGTMYLADERFTKTLDAYGEGTAKLMSEAMRRLKE